MPEVPFIGFEDQPEKQEKKPVDVGGIFATVGASIVTGGVIILILVVFVGIIWNVIQVMF